MTGTVVLAGLGSEFRRDDGAGPLVVRRVASMVPGVTGFDHIAEPLDLLGRWDGAALAVVVDSTSSGGPPGEVRLVELDERPELEGQPGLPVLVPAAPTSTHGIGLVGALRLARALGRAPARVVLVAIEGREFGSGDELSPGVAAGILTAADRVLALLQEAV